MSDSIQSPSELHPSIVALVALSAHTASGHPDQGLCQLDKLKSYGITDAQIDLVLDIARHIRDEAAQKLDDSFNKERRIRMQLEDGFSMKILNKEESTACCTPTANGEPCC